MLKIKRILFPTDFSTCAEQAFEKALSFAKHFDAELIIFHCCILPRTDTFDLGYYLKDIEKEKKLLCDHVNQQLLTNVTHAKIEHVKIKHHQENAIDASQSIANYAKEIDADLIVMGTHGRHGFSLAFMGSVAEKVVRLSDCPVMPIKQSNLKLKTKRFVVPIDFSPSSRVALSIGKYLAETFHAKLYVLNIISYSAEPILYKDRFASAPEKIPEIIDARNSELEVLFRSTEGPDVNVEFHTKLGAAYEISKFAENQNADLIIISSHGNHNEKDDLIGSTSEKVIRTSSCPVLTLKSFGKSLIEERKI